MLSGCLRVATGVQVTVEGKRHLGAALGSRLFTEQYVSEKVDSWSCCIAKLSDIVHPHAAYILPLRMVYVTNGLTFCIPFQGSLHF